MERSEYKDIFGPNLIILLDKLTYAIEHVDLYCKNEEKNKTIRRLRATKGEKVMHFKTSKKCADYFNISAPSISIAVNKKKKFRGWTIEFVED